MNSFFFLHRLKLISFHIVCRTKDIFLTSSIGRKSSGGSSVGPKERPKLNLTVKKELQGMGGQMIMAQSRMAKGPDGTNGFAPGWTTRVSTHSTTEEKEDEDAPSLSASASEFVPNFPVAASGFESVEILRREEEG